ncbi:hypothetical protein [Chryseolinea soli]|uniref:Collagen-like protein n=1 Tax=Chryseolinea soli TaxID=2321403 RepID=A0A385STC7_9BACT|nr:hypothetical protein [Chryseolinea soli]AYB32058.1 hypothetical protein D4L85_16430 [Chryseolinea soli]
MSKITERLDVSELLLLERKKNVLMISAEAYYRAYTIIFDFKVPFLFYIGLITLLFVPTLSNAQIRIPSLEIPRNTSYEIPGDTLLVDHLIMHDSSKLILNKTCNASFIKAKKITAGVSCSIVGNGNNGTNGKNGKDSDHPYGPCKSGVTGEQGKSGTNGTSGKNLTLEVDYLELNHLILINLNGGNGGYGGNGGNGSSGNKGTAHCLSNGGDGGNGGNGGDGGSGGSLALSCTNCGYNFSLSEKVKLVNHGGYRGFEGEGGMGGIKGNGSSEKVSRHGNKGKNGLAGKNGKDGNFTYAK